MSVPLVEQLYYTIGIAGGSGSGKTTFIRKLKERFSEKDLCIISQDNYYYEHHRQVRDRQGVKNFDLPSSIDIDGFYADIMKLQKGESISRQEYNYNNPDKTPEILTLHAAPVIIVEGLFVFCEDRFKQMFDLKLMIDATDDKKIIRRIVRDRVERNYPLEDVLYRYEHHVVPSYERFIEPHKKDADLVINNNINFDIALDVISAFISCQLDRGRIS